MTLDEAIAEVEEHAAGITRWEDCPDFVDEVTAALMAEIKRLRRENEDLKEAALVANLNESLHISESEP